MPKAGKDEVNFEINCTKAKWEPKTIADIPRVVSRSFERELSLKDISPLVGTDHVKSWAMDEDSDIPIFLKEKSMLNEAFAEKVIRFKLPKGVFPKNWQPKKVKILAKGPRIAKYFGEDQCGERQVQVSLKLFECGHFYLKQTLPGSGISPHWTIFEGTWEHTDRGLKIEYLIRYSWQVSRKPEFDLNIEAVPEGWSSSLAWSGDSETQLNGNIPAVVGSEKWCWVEVYRDADNMPKTAARFNDECDDVSWKDGSWKNDLKSNQKSTGSADAPETSMKDGDSKGDATPHQRRDAAAERPRPQASSSSSGSAAGASATKQEEKESDLPLYVALAVFVVILAYFAWQQWEEKSAAWAADRAKSELW